MTEAPNDRARPAVPLEWLALAAALAPFVVAIVRAAVKDWFPVGDAAYFTVRSADVLTAHHPLVGAWSSGSAVVGVPVNNLGPLQLDVLAPFTKLSPDLGTAIGSALINAASVAMVWLAARRLFRPAVVVFVMAATTLLVASLGLSWLIDARQQNALVLPLYALLWLSAAMWAGVGIAVPIAVVLASLVLQTHFTYGYPAGIVLLAGLVGFVLATWASRAAWKRIATWSLVLGALCWLQPLIDQFAGTGNLGDVLGPARERPGAGIEVGVQVLAGAALVPPFWLPAVDAHVPASRRRDQPARGRPRCRRVVARRRRRRRARLACRGRRPPRRAGLAGVIAIVAGLVAATRIPISSFGLVPQNYYWAWSLAGFVSIAVVAGACSLPIVVQSLRIGSSAQRRAVLAGLALVTMAVAVWPRYPVASVAADEVEAQRVGRPLRAQLAAAIAAGVVPDRRRSRLVAGLLRQRPSVRHARRACSAPGSSSASCPRAATSTASASRGASRLAAISASLLIAGADPELAPGSVIVAEVVGISDEELAEYVTLQERFGDLLRDGAIDVDGLAHADVAAGPVGELDAVLASPDSPATGLARHLDGWRRSGIVSIPAAVGEDFAHWLQLEQRSSADYQTIVLEQPSAPDNRAC